MQRYDELFIIRSLCLNEAHENFFCVHLVQELVALVCIGAALKLHTEIQRTVSVFMMNTIAKS